MDTRYRKHAWSKLTNFRDKRFERYDFTDTSFDNVNLWNVNLIGCDFTGSDFSGVGVFACDFTGCAFTKADLRRMPIGNQGGTFRDCTFTMCDLRGQGMWLPHFANCTFDRCKLTGVNFNDATFESCTFIGKLADVTFNGIYHRERNGRPPLRDVDFSRAVLGEFVTFEDCDLASCTPPAGRRWDKLLYRLFRSRPSVLSTGSKDRIVLD